MELIIHSIIMAVIGNTCQNAIIISDKIKWQNLMLTIGKTNIERQFSAKKKKKVMSISGEDFMTNSKM